MIASAPDFRDVALRGIAAGCAGGALLGIALFLAGMRAPAGAASFELGALYMAIAIAWGIGYASVAATRPQLSVRPVLSGLVFGGLVYVVTQIALYGVAAEQTHTAQQVGFGLAATCLLFGLPVAFIARRPVRKPL